MATNFLTQLFGSRNDRLLKQFRKTVERINALEPEFEKLDDAALRAKTDEFKNRVAGGEALDDLLPEAFAVVREGSKRVMKMRHFDVNYWAAWHCISARFPRCAPAKARPSQRRFRCISML